MSVPDHSQSSSDHVNQSDSVVYCAANYRKYYICHIWQILIWPNISGYIPYVGSYKPLFWFNIQLMEIFSLLRYFSTRPLYQAPTFTCVPLLVWINLESINCFPPNLCSPSLSGNIMALSDCGPLDRHYGTTISRNHMSQTTQYGNCRTSVNSLIDAKSDPKTIGDWFKGRPWSTMIPPGFA